jgi:hypothetical protein
MRTLPPPSILPSIVMSTAISDSLPPHRARRASGAGIGFAASSGFDTVSNRVGSLSSGVGVGFAAQRYVFPEGHGVGLSEEGI